MTDEFEDGHEQLKHDFSKAWQLLIESHILLLRLQSQNYLVLAILNGAFTASDSTGDWFMRWMNLCLATLMCLAFIRARLRIRKFEMFREHLKPVLVAWLRNCEGVSEIQWDSMVEQLEATTSDATK